jgi:hypothetical protein
MDSDLNMDNSGMDFATIDELLDGDEEEDEVPELPALKQETVEDNEVSAELEPEPSTSFLMKADDVEVDREDVMLLEDNLVDEIEEEIKRETVTYPPLNKEKMNIFASSLLDDIISQKELQGALEIQPNSALEGQSV